jgi:chromosome partitioning protein
VIVAVMADKGGVGKTTTAHNLGIEIARTGKRVLLIDADKQADLTELAGVASEPNIGVDAILLQRPTPGAGGYIQKTGEGVDLIGTHPHMRRADRDLAQRTRREYVLSESLKDIAGSYDVIIADVGHSELVQLNVLAVADVLLVPSTPAKLDADHIANMVDEAELMRRDLGLHSLTDRGRVIVSLTRRMTRAGIEAAGLELIRERFASMLAPAVIPATPRAIEASAMKMSLRAYRDRYGTKRDRALGEAVDSYEALAGHVLRLAPALEGVA